MKPLLSAPLTLDDELIWDHCVWSVPRYPWHALRHGAVAADRRDAELMYQAQLVRRRYARDSMLCITGLWIGGALERFTGLDELGRLL